MTNELEQRAPEDWRNTRRMRAIADNPGYLRYIHTGRRRGRWAFSDPVSGYAFEVFDTPEEAIDAALRSAEQPSEPVSATYTLQPSAPEEEYVAVPRECTDLMIEQGAAAIEVHQQAVGKHASAEALAGVAYDVMIACAPPAPRKPTDYRILWGVVANAGRLSHSREPRWSHVKHATALGSTSSISLCQRFGFDPDEMVGGMEESDEGAEAIEAAQEPAAPWQPIALLPANCDDLFWFLRGDVVDGPRTPQHGGYDADEWDYFAPCESPAINPAPQQREASEAFITAALALREAVRQYECAIEEGCDAGEMSPIEAFDMASKGLMRP